jgi:hypothetical protein
MIFANTTKELQNSGKTSTTFRDLKNTAPSMPSSAASRLALTSETQLLDELPHAEIDHG